MRAVTVRVHLTRGADSADCAGCKYRVRTVWASSSAHRSTVALAQRERMAPRARCCESVRGAGRGRWSTRLSDVADIRAVAADRRRRSIRQEQATGSIWEAGLTQRAPLAWTLVARAVAADSSGTEAARTG